MVLNDNGLDISAILPGGRFLYKTLEMQQHPNIDGAFTKLFTEVKPARILEIGTANGGLTLYLRHLLDSLGMQDTQIITYDVDTRGLDNFNRVKANGIVSRVENIFTDDMMGIKSNKIADILGYINAEGVSIILCDGAHKASEMNIFAHLIKPGDILMGHDYQDDPKWFYSASDSEKLENQAWFWCELGYDSVQTATLTNNIYKFMNEDFSKVAWLCTRKDK